MDKFEKSMRTSQLVGGGVEVMTEVVIEDEIVRYHNKYDLNVPEAVKQFKEDFYPVYEADKLSSDYGKEIKLEVAYDLIGNLDDSIVHTVWIDRAIEKLQQLKHVRENMPF